MPAVSESPEAAQLELEPLFGRDWVPGPRHLLVTLWFAAFALYLNYLPLYYTDLWSHVQYGQWMLEQRTIPTEDLFMPLAQGMPLLDSAWLSQVIFAQAEQWQGPEGLSTLYTVVMVLTYLMLTRVFYLQSGRLGLAVGGMVLALFVGVPRYLVMRPEMFGALAFALLLWIAVRETNFQERRDEAGDLNGPTDKLQRWLPFVAVPLIFVAWANLHGSFVMGLAVLGCYGLGRVIEVAWRRRDAMAVLTDRGVLRWLAIGELALAGTMINPFGMDLLISTLLFSSNPNLKDITEWYPLKLIDLEGIECVVAWIILGVVLRHSRRRVRAAELLLLGLFTLATAISIRFIAWYSPVLVLVIMPHAADIANRLWPATEPQPTPSADTQPVQGVVTYRYLVLCIVVIWLTFAYSPSSRPLLGGTPRRPDQYLNTNTPHELTAWMRANPDKLPQGQIWNPQNWGDWLVWDGPKDLKVFVTSQIHLIPPFVWKDYLRIFNMNSGWELALRRYHVNAIVVNKFSQPQFAQVIRRESNWQVKYEDDVAMLLVAKWALAEPAAESKPESDAEPAAAAAAAEAPDSNSKK